MNDDFFVRILNAVGAPYNPYWRVDALEHAALNALALVRVQVLIIDEVHQLLAGSAREQRLSLNLIKSVSNDLRDLDCRRRDGGRPARH